MCCSICLWRERLLFGGRCLNVAGNIYLSGITVVGTEDSPPSCHGSTLMPWMVPVVVKKPSFRLISLSISVVQIWFDYQNVAIDHTKTFPKGFGWNIIIDIVIPILVTKNRCFRLSKSATRYYRTNFYVGIQKSQLTHVDAHHYYSNHTIIWSLCI